MLGVMCLRLVVDKILNCSLGFLGLRSSIKPAAVAGNELLI